jgi:hypothetical protein
LAEEEGQSLEAMLGDLAISIGICRRLFELLRTTPLPSRAMLNIRVYDRVPYFAYHRQDDEVIVGFYFLSRKGSSSAAYELVDGDTKRVFEGHFDLISSESASATIVEYDGARERANFNEALFADLRRELLAKLPAADELISRTPLNGALSKSASQSHN